MHKIGICKILFVCLGNICRSPLAEGVARKYIKENKLKSEVDSCGTGDWHIAEPPCPNAVKVAKLHNIDISSLKARQITREDFTAFDIIVALDSNNIASLIQLGCPQDKIVKLGAFGRNNEDVPDPYFFEGFEGFEYVYTMIDECIQKLFASTKC